MKISRSCVHGSEETESLDARHERLLRLGFEQGEPVHEWPVDDPDQHFQIRESLFQSTYSRVVPIHLTSADSSVRLRVVIVKAEARYDSYGFTPGGTPVGDWEIPGWYLEGWVLTSGFDKCDKVVRVRIVWEDPMLSDSLLWQIIPEEPNPAVPFEIVNW